MPSVATVDPSPEGRSARRIAILGLVALLLLTLTLLGLPYLVRIDAAVWHAILLERGCATDDAVDRIVHLTTWAMALLVAAAAGRRTRASGWRAAWPPLALIAVGSLTGKVLKNVFVRERPSMLPGLALGHSFPSGHVMNTAMAAIAVILLVHGLRRRRWWTTIAVAMIVVTAAGRVVLSHHWLSDVIGGVLAAAVLAGLAWSPFQTRPLLAPATVAAALAAILTVVTHARHLAIVLPSALVGNESTTASGVSTVWLEGSETIPVEVPALESGAPNQDQGDAYVVLGGRPDTAVRGCVTLRVAVNDRELPPIVSFVGWREYRFRLPRGTVRPGTNQVRLDVRNERGAPWRFAVAYIGIHSSLAGERRALVMGSRATPSRSHRHRAPTRDVLNAPPPGAG